MPAAAILPILGKLAMNFGPQLLSSFQKRGNDKKLYGEVESFYGGLRDQAKTQMDSSLAAREAAKQQIGVGDTYRKYLDQAMQDPMSDFLRNQAMRNQAESIGALKSGGARAILGGVGAVQSQTQNDLQKIAAGEQDRKLGALKTYGAIEQQQNNKRIDQMLRDARGDLGLARSQYGEGMLKSKQAELDNMRSGQEFQEGLLSTGIDMFDFARELFQSGGKTPGEFSHRTNPIHLIQDGEKVGEATGGEYIVNPEQARRITKESKFARQLFKKFEKRARS